MSFPPQQHPGVSDCPRHPDRESFVLCQRCGRPACPQCQVQAAVGVQCVDCVREGAATGRPARTQTGALVRGGRPVVTFGFIAACVAALLLQITIPSFTSDFGFAPFLGREQPWRYITSAFLHDDSRGLLSFHLLMNAYCLWALGQELEPNLGRLRYIVVLFLTALGGSVAYQLLLGRDSFSLMIGASGVVFGLFGFLLSAGLRLGLDIRSIVAVVAINGVLGFLMPNVAWQGHLGGLVVGAILGLIFTAGSPKNRTAVQLVGCGAVFAALVVTALLG